MITKAELLDIYIRALSEDDVKRLDELIKSPKSTYNDLYKFVSLTTRKLIRAFKLVEPDGEFMSLEDAEDLIRPLLELHSELMAESAKTVQSNLNDVNRVGLKARKVTPSKDRMDGIIKELTSGPFEDTKWILGSGVMAYSRSIADETCHINAEAQYAAGLTPVIERTTSGKCCSWCDHLAGVWTYPDVPREVYMRHRGCDCIVEYKNGKRSQNVHTKQWTDLPPSEVIQKPHASLSRTQAKDYENYLKQKKRNDRINEIAQTRGISWEDAKRQEHLQSERLRDRARYRAGQRRNSRYR